MLEMCMLVTIEIMVACPLVIYINIWKYSDVKNIHKNLEYVANDNAIENPHTLWAVTSIKLTSRGKIVNLILILSIKNIGLKNKNVNVYV